MIDRFAIDCTTGCARSCRSDTADRERRIPYLCAAHDGFAQLRHRNASGCRGLAGADIRNGDGVRPIIAA